MAEDNLNQGFTPEQVKNAESIRDSMAGIRQSVNQLNKALDQSGGSLSNASGIFKQIENSAGKVAGLQKEATDSAKGTEKALKEQIKNQNIVLTLNQKINDLYNRALDLRVQAMKAKKKERQEMLDQADLLERQSKNLAAARDNSQELANTYKSIVDSSTVLDSHTTFFRGLERVVKDIPIIRKLPLGFEEAAKAARQAAKHNLEQSVYLGKIDNLSERALKNGKGLNKQKLEELGLLEITQGKTGSAAAKMLRSYKNSSKQINVMGAGFKVLGTQLKAALGPLLFIDLAVKAIKGFVNLFIGANKQAVDLARSLGTSVESADAMRNRFRDIRTDSNSTLYNIQYQIDATKELVELTGTQRRISEDIIKNQVFLTKRVGATAAEAANLNLLFQAFDKNAEKGVDTMLEMSKSFAETNGIGISINTVLKDVSSAGSEIAGYFGFSTEELTQAVIRTRRLGVNLNQAKNIAEGLLNFESSISSELEAELLTGQQFNLERARMLAFTGDIAGATEDVLTQMQNLTEEQRKSPIIMKSMAAATGLSVEELNKAFLIQEDLNLRAQEYENIVRSGSQEAKQAFLERYGIDQALREQIESRISLEEQYKEALLDVKQQFMGLVEGGFIDILVDAIKGIANFVSIFTGKSLAQREEERLQRMEARGATGTKAYEELKAKIEGREAGRLMDERNIMYGRYAGMGSMRLSTYTPKPKNSQEDGVEELAVGGIVTRPTKALVGEAGAEAVVPLNEFYAKMDELITAVKSGGDVYMDGNKVGQSLVLSTYKST